MSNIVSIYYDFGGPVQVMAQKADFYNLSPDQTAEYLELAYMFAGNPASNHRLTILMDTKQRHEDTVTFTIKTVSTNIAGTIISGYQRAWDYSFTLSLPDVFGKDDWIHYQELCSKEDPSWDEFLELDALKGIFPDKLKEACEKKGLKDDGNGLTHSEMIEMFVDYKQEIENFRLPRLAPRLVTFDAPELLK